MAQRADTGKEWICKRNTTAGLPHSTVKRSASGGHAMYEKLMTKLAAACASPPQDWSPSAPPPASEIARPSSSQATRKSRAGGAISSSSFNPSRTGSPSYNEAPSRSSPAGGSGNEAFFERMGNANSQRSGDLPPSQGGKYAGFGSTPEPSYGSSSHPSDRLSSRSAPTFEELQTNPLGALSKGWGLFSSAVSSASREINETVVKPGMSRAQEIAQGQGGNDEWRNYLAGIGSNAKEASAWLGQRAGEGLEGFSGAAKDRGLDLDEHLQKMGLGPTQRPGYEGYGQLGKEGEGSGGRDDDFFDSWDDQPAAKPSTKPVAASTPAPASGKAPAAKKNDGWNDDEWNDF